MVQNLIQNRNPRTQQDTRWRHCNRQRDSMADLLQPPDGRSLVPLVREWKARESCQSYYVMRDGFDGACMLATIQTIGYSVRGVSELLRLVELLSSHAVGRNALHALWFPDARCCGLETRCAFCDDADRRTSLFLGGGGNDHPLQIECLLFDWHEIEPSEPFNAIVAEFKRLVALATPCSTRYRAYPIDIDINLAPTDIGNTEALLHHVQQAHDDGDDASIRLRIVRFWGESSADDPDVTWSALAAIARTRLRVYASLVGPQWQLLLHSTSESIEAPDLKHSILALTDVRYLEMELPEPDPRLLPALQTTLASHCRSMRMLTLDVRFFGSTPATRDAVLEFLARTVFSTASALRLEELELDFASFAREVAFADENVERMTAIVIDDNNTERPSVYRHRRLTIKHHSWRGASGAAIARLLRAAGGVRELVLGSKDGTDAISAGDVGSIVAGLPTLHALVVDVSSVQLERAEADDHEDARGSSLASLGLRFHSLDTAQVERALDCILRVSGAQLTTLSIGSFTQPGDDDAPTNALLTGGGAAQLMLARCPRLQRLDLGPVDDAFVASLVDALRDGDEHEHEHEHDATAATGTGTGTGTSTGTRCCGLRALRLVAHSVDVTFDALLHALRSRSHPLARSLTSLELCLPFPCCQDDHLNVELDETQAATRSRMQTAEMTLLTRLQSLLSENERLQRVTMAAAINEHDEEELLEAIDGRRFASAWPTTRQRMATLSALRSRQLPRDVLASILELAGRRCGRLRCLHADVARARERQHAWCLEKRSQWDTYG
ncbi:hypothetical protein PINS_up019373 [Pythium insidiosum]|nr:hypothetical protein PINS_up019373 [Pythium insidiosum]